MSAFAAEIVWGADRRLAVIVNYSSPLRGVKPTGALQDAEADASHDPPMRSTEHVPERVRDVARGRGESCCPLVSNSVAATTQREFGLKISESSPFLFCKTGVILAVRAIRPSHSPEYRSRLSCLARGLPIHTTASVDHRSSLTEREGALRHARCPRGDFGIRSCADRHSRRAESGREADWGDCANAGVGPRDRSDHYSSPPRGWCLHCPARRRAWNEAIGLHRRAGPSARRAQSALAGKRARGSQAKRCGACWLGALTGACGEGRIGDRPRRLATYPSRRGRFGAAHTRPRQGRAHQLGEPE